MGRVFKFTHTNFESFYVSRKFILFLDHSNCTKAAVEEFPADFLTPEQRKNGGIVHHFMIGTQGVLLKRNFGYKLNVDSNYL